MPHASCSHMIYPNYKLYYFSILEYPASTFFVTDYYVVCIRYQIFLENWLKYFWHSSFFFYKMNTDNDLLLKF